MLGKEFAENDAFRQALFGKAILELEVGNLVTESTDAIVNPAQTTLFPGGGVDGEIHLWGGPRIWEACRDLHGCETGDAKISTGGELKARYVVHTVGPVWTGGSAGEADALASCYRRCLEVAAENGAESLAFPAISTGHYGYPMEEAATIALCTVVHYLRSHDNFRLVRFVLKGRDAFALHALVMDRVLSEETAG